jgi:AraC-like DNA-binding protein
MENKSVFIDFSDFQFKVLSCFGYENSNHACGCIDDHHHGDCYEILYHTKGEQEYWVDKEHYKLKGKECLIIHPGEIHGSGSALNERKVYYSLTFPLPQVTESYLGMSEADTKKILYIFNSSRRHFLIEEDIGKYFRQIMIVVESSNGLKTAEITINFLNILRAISESYESAPRRIPEYVKQLQKLIASRPTIEINYDCFLSSYGIEKSLLAQEFLKHIGVTIKNYTLAKQIDLAEELMRTTDLSVTQVALESGFSSSQHFAMMYKKFRNISPSEYRKSAKCNLKRHNNPSLDPNLMNLNGHNW